MKRAFFPVATATGIECIQNEKKKCCQLHSKSLSRIGGHHDWTVPSVSVIIPAYNEEESISACIESLEGTKYPNLEIIVVDDYSRDKTVEVASRYSVKVIKRNTRGGIAFTRNDGLRLARSEITAFVDTDCTVAPDWLDLLTCDFADPSIAGVGGIIRPRNPAFAVYRSFTQSSRNLLRTYVNKVPAWRKQRISHPNT